MFEICRWKERSASTRWKKLGENSTDVVGRLRVDLLTRKSRKFYSFLTLIVTVEKSLYSPGTGSQVFSLSSSLVIRTAANQCKFGCWAVWVFNFVCNSHTIHWLLVLMYSSEYHMQWRNAPSQPQRFVQPVVLIVLLWNMKLKDVRWVNKQAHVSNDM